MTNLFTLNLRIVTILLTLVLAFGSASAKYTVYKFVQPVKVMRGQEEVPISKDLELKSNDKVTIGQGGEIQILNSFDKSISISGKPGTSDVLTIILNAAHHNPSVVVVPPAPNKPVENVNAVGGTTRGDFDPYLNDADCHLLGAALMDALDAKSFPSMPIPVDVTSKEGEYNYALFNSTSSPLYFNVITFVGDSLAPSPLGQPISSYVLDPNNGIKRLACAAPGSRHLIVMSPCYFSISELLGCIRENETSPLGRPKAPSQQALPLYLYEIK